MSLDINLTNVQSIPIVVSSNTTAENNKVYHVIANATFTDPTPVEGRGYVVLLVNGTFSFSSGGGTFSQRGTLVFRQFLSGAWYTLTHDERSYNANTFVPQTRTINGLDLSANRTLTTANINDSSNKRYVTDAQLTVLGNTSGTNTGDQNLSGLVPYTGATADVDLGNNDLNAEGIKIKGTAGNGHLNLKHQSSASTAGGGESVIYADNSGNPKWKNDGNAVQDVMLGSATTQARLNLEIFEAKQVSATQTTTGTTPIAITELKVTPTINKRYNLTACIRVGSSGSNGVIIGITAPSGANIFVTAFGTAIPGSSNSPMSFINASGQLFQNAFTLANSDNGMCIVHGEIEMGATSGYVQFTFRSAASGQTSRILKTGSFMKLEEI